MTSQGLSWYSSAAIAAIGVTVFGGYLIWAARSQRQATQSPARPWRSGASAICLIVSLMFFVGVNYLNPKTSPALFLIFWTLILMLTGWACVLALKDILHTRKLFTADPNDPAGKSAKTDALQPTDPEERI